MSPKRYNDRHAIASKRMMQVAKLSTLPTWHNWKQRVWMILQSLGVADTLMSLDQPDPDTVVATIVNTDFESYVTAEEIKAITDLHASREEEKKQVDALQADRHATFVTNYEDMCNEVATMILMSLSDDIATKLRTVEAKPYRLWKALHSLFERRNTMSLHRMITAFHSIKMKKGEDLEAFLARVDYLATELRKSNQPVNDTAVISVILQGIHKEPRFAALVPILEDKDDLMLVQERLRDQELKCSLDEPNSRGSVVPTSAFTTYEGKDYCKAWYFNGDCKFGDSCKYVHGVRPGERQTSRPGASGRAGQDVICNYCQRPGHYSRNCRKKKRDKRKNERAMKATARSTLDPAFMIRAVSASVKADAFAVRQQPSTSEIEVVADTGAGRSMWATKAGMTNTRQVHTSVLAAIGPPVQVREMGDLALNTDLGTLMLKDVLVVPQLNANLMSMSCLEKDGHSFERGDNNAIEIRNSLGQLVGEATLRDDGLYRLSGTVAATPALTTSTPLTTDAMELMHRRTGHAPIAQLTALQGKVKGLSLTKPQGLDSYINGVCQPCQEGKATRKRIPKRATRKATQAGERICSDVVGPFSVEGTDHCRYFVSFIDEYSGAATAFFMKKKSMVLDCFKAFLAMATKHNKNVKYFRTDGGGEYTSHAFEATLRKAGIRHEVTNPHSPFQNGQAERWNRTIVGKAKALLQDSGFDKKFWVQAIRHAVYLYNRATVKASHGITPFEAWTGKQPDIGHLRIFGCLAHMLVPKANRRKLDPNTKTAFVMGFSDTSRKYQLWVPQNNRFVSSCDVSFDESIVYGDWKRSQESKAAVQAMNDDHSSDEWSDSLDDEASAAAESDTDDGADASEDAEDEADAAHSETDDEDEDEGTEDEAGDSDEAVGTEGEDDEVVDAAHKPDAAGLRRSSRVSRPPSEYWRVQPSAGANVNKGLFVSVPTDPTTYSQAMNGPWASEWKQAMQIEFDSLMANNTFGPPVMLPRGRKALGCKWVYKVKLNGEGQVDKFKARLVAQGFTQVKSIDYNEVFAPVARASTIRVILAIAAQLDLELRQYDVASAYLYGVIKEELYIRQPRGFADPSKSGFVRRLLKALYGLKQSGRLWYFELDGTLVNDFGFVRCRTDNCLYVFLDGKRMMFVAVFVDDLLVATNDMELLERLEQVLTAKYKISKLGEPTWILQMRVHRDKTAGSISLDQKPLVMAILDRYGMSDCKPAPTPSVTGQVLTKDHCPSSPVELRAMASVPYRSVVGSLLYLSLSTRADIAAAVAVVSRFVSNPGQAHWTAAKRILRYLKGTTDLGIVFTKDTQVTEPGLTGYCDASWGGDLDSRCSTTGYVFHIANGPVVWRSKLQKAVAKSSAEAEYLAVSAAVSECIWLRMLLSELGFIQAKATEIYEDNQACIAMSQNPAHHQRAKHIDIHYHFVKDHCAKGNVILVYLPTNDMVADMLTKPTGRVKFLLFRAALMGHQQHDDVSLRGRVGFGHFHSS